MKDFRGIDIASDSIILYPTRKGSTVRLVEARVVGISETDTGARTTLTVQPTRSSNGIARDGKFVKLTALKNVVVIG